MEVPTQNVESAQPDYAGLNGIQQEVQGQENLNPDFLKQIRSEATPGIKLAAIRRLRSAHEEGQADVVLETIRLANILGLGEKDPQGAEILNTLSNFYRVEKPNVEEAVVEQASIPQRYFELPVFQDNPTNRAIHTFLPQDTLRRVFIDTKLRWPRVSGQAPEDRRRVDRVYNHISKVYLSNTALTKDQKRRLAQDLATLFEDEDMRSSYPQLAEYVENVGTKEYQPPDAIDGTLLAFLYSLKIISDSSSPLPKHSRRKILAMTAALAAGLAVAGVSLQQPGKAEETVSSTPTSPESSKEQLTIFDEFIKPLVEESKRRRKRNAESDPNYPNEVNRLLNEGRVNAILLGRGIHLRPGLPSGIFNANKILSFNTKTKTVDSVSITSDTRNPRAERYLKGKGEIPRIYGINESFDIGRFELNRKTFQEATGLDIDFQIVFSDEAIRDFVNLLGGLDVYIPFNLSTYKIKFADEEEEHPEKNFTIGIHHLNGAEAVQFMKAQDWAGWEKDRLPHHRAEIIIDEIIKAAKGKLDNFVGAVVFGAQVKGFFDEQIRKGAIKLDFDPYQVLNFGALKDRVTGKPSGFDEVKKGQSIVMMDTNMGSGEDVIRFISKDANENPISRKDVDEGVYGEDWWAAAVPKNGNPYADDLVTGYWQSTRNLVKQRLYGTS